MGWQFCEQESSARRKLGPAKVQDDSDKLDALHEGCCMQTTHAYFSLYNQCGTNLTAMCFMFSLEKFANQ